MISKLILLLSMLMLTGCASHYYVGWNFLDGNHYVLNNVSSKVDNDMKDICNLVISSISNYDLTPLKPYFAPKLAQALDQTMIERINYQLKKRYKFNKQNVQGKIGDQMPSGLPDPGDNFDIYDFMEAQFTLNGDPGVKVLIFVTKIEGVTKLCGLSIKDENDPLVVMYPETLDKFGMFSKKRFGTSYEPVK